MKNKKVFWTAFICTIAVVLIIVLVCGCLVFGNKNQSPPDILIPFETEHLIDAQYNQKRISARNNAELIGLNVEYTIIFEDKIDYYYRVLTEHYSQTGQEDLYREIKQSENDWDAYFTQQRSANRRALLSSGSTGNELSLRLSDIDRTMCRAKAIELYNLCNTCNIEVEQL